MLTIRTIPAFNDNYFWLFHAQDSTAAAVVDPGAAEPVIETLEHNGLALEAILVTHHHFDHTGGVKQLAERYGAVVYGPAESKFDGIGIPLHEGDVIEVIGTRFRVIEVPGHTLDHIAYFAAETGDAPILFSGDTLFAGGCGRLFEGTPAQMTASLDKLAALPDATRVFCAHEYTLANLAFAVAVEPDNDALERRVIEARSLRDDGRPTVPSTIALERQTNPFVRNAESSVVAMAREHAGRELAPGAETLAAIRGWKDNF